MIIAKQTIAYGAAAAIGAIAAFAAYSAPAAAQSEPFFRGKQVSLVIGYGPGGGYDTYARFLARFMGKHLPGKPAIVPRNMPGAGSLAAANHIYNVVPKDGTVIGTVSQNVALMQVLGQKGIQFDAAKFNWIGRITDADAVIGVWHTSPAKTIEDVRKHPTPIAVGSGLSGSVLYVTFLNELTGMKFEPIAGYGSGPAMLAMERGEIEGNSSLLWSALKAKNPDWVRDNKVRILVQITLDKIPDLLEVPRLVDLAKNDDDRRMMATVTATNVIGRSILAPPGVPSERVKVLRAAFDATVHDPDFLAQAKKSRLDVNAMSGDKLAKLVADSTELPAPLVERMKQMASIKVRKVEKSGKSEKKKKEKN
ncbi:MAG: Bug family tripartite tricarboxylate transporter substrate binding protein [Hyphomicrobiaceae bacterium]